MRLNGEQHHARRLAVDAVHRRQGVDTELALQAHQQGLLQIASAWSHWQKMRLVDREHMVILKQHHFIEGNAFLDLDAAIVEQLEMCGVEPLGQDIVAELVDHIATRHARLDLVARHIRETLHQKIDHSHPGADRQHNTARSDAVAGRQLHAAIRCRRVAGRAANATRRRAHPHKHLPAWCRFPAAWCRARCGCRTQNTRPASPCRHPASAENN